MNVKRVYVGRLGANCYIVEQGGEVLIIDPAELSDELLDYVKENKDKITKILLTHRHFDHLLGVADLKKLTDAQIIIHELDREGLLSAKHSLAEYFQFSQTTVTPDLLCKDGDKIPFGDIDITVLHTPGHTIGSVCYIMGEVMFTGDTLFKGDVGRQDLPTGDSATLLSSIKMLKALEQDYTVYPGHGLSTTLSNEKMYNPAMNGSDI